MMKMTTRTKIYLGNKKGKRKGLLIFTTPHQIPREVIEEIRQGLIAYLQDDNRAIAVLNLPKNSKWQYINLK